MGNNRIRQYLAADCKEEKDNWLENNLTCKQPEICYNSLSKKCICPKNNGCDFCINSGNRKSTENNGNFELLIFGNNFL